MVLVLRLAAPFVREGSASRETHLAVNYQHSAMRTAIGSIQSPRLDGVLIGEFAPRIGHLTNVSVVESPGGANPIEQDAHFHAGPRPFAKRIAKPMAGGVRLKN